MVVSTLPGMYMYCLVLTDTQYAGATNRPCITLAHILPVYRTHGSFTYETEFQEELKVSLVTRVYHKC